MRMALAAAPLALLTLLGAQEAMAQRGPDTGRKNFANDTPSEIIVEIGTRTSNGIGFPNTGGPMTIRLYPHQTQWWDYKGPYLDWMVVSGGVRCEVRAKQPGDQADRLLNTNTFLSIVANGNECVIRGHN